MLQLFFLGTLLSLISMTVVQLVEASRRIKVVGARLRFQPSMPEPPPPPPVTIALAGAILEVAR